MPIPSNSNTVRLGSAFQLADVPNLWPADAGVKQGGMKDYDNTLNSLKIKKAMPPPYAE